MINENNDGIENNEDAENNDDNNDAENDDGNNDNDDKAVIVAYNTLMTHNKRMFGNELSTETKQTKYKHNDAMEEELNRCDKTNNQNLILDYIKKIEEFDGKISVINEEKNYLYKEMKDKNICIGAIKEIVKERKKDPALVETININKDLYKKYLCEDCEIPEQYL
jgi:uncharacterized protein (UPF0335 family)